MRCNGHYPACLEGTAALNDDLLCARPLAAPVDNATDYYGQPVRVKPNWPYNRLHGELEDLPLSRRRHCFMPFRRVSRRALRLMAHQILSNTSSGYFEVRGALVGCAVATNWGWSGGGSPLSCWCACG